MKKSVLLRTPQPSISAIKPQRRSRTSWKNREEHRAFFDQLGQTFGIQKPEEWCKIKMNDVEKAAGLGLLNHYYDGSLLKALHTVYPEHILDLQPWKFSRVPNKFWANNLEFQRQFFDWLKHPSRLNVSSYEDWYRVSSEQIIAHGGHSLMKKVYHYSVYAALCKIYPEHNWNIWKFARHPKGFWSKEQNVVGYLNYLQDHFGIKHLDDWYSISNFELPKSLLERYGGLIPMLAQFYPEHPWRLSKEGMPMMKTQSYLQRMLTSLFPPKTEIRVNYRHPAMLYSSTNREMELDIYMPEFDMAFEYQGQHHYEDTVFYGDHTFQIIKDTEKHMACTREKITLIPIPYWWDRSVASLIATIVEKRNDLMPLLATHIKGHSKKFHPIPSSHPRRSSSLLRKPRKIGFDLTNPSKWILSGPVSIHNDPSGWWLIESFSTAGIYTCYDGRGNFHLRNRSSLTASDDFTNLLPKMYLEGHLFCEGKTFNQVWDQLSRGDWSDVQFRILDAPTQKSFPFEDRLQVIKTQLSHVNTTRVQLAEPIKCENRQHLQQYIHDVESRGHTVLLRKPASLYSQQFALYSAASYDLVHAQVSALDVPKKLITCKLIGGKTIQLPLKTTEHANTSTAYTLTPDTVKVGDILALKFMNESTPLVVRNEQDNSWESVIETSSPLPFRVTQGRGQPKCRSCKKMIKDKEELRIEIKGAFTRGHQPYAFPAKYSVCFDSNCFSEVVSESRKSSGMFLPNFDQTLSIPESFLHHSSPEVQQQIRNFTNMGVQWYLL